MCGNKPALGFQYGVRLPKPQTSHRTAQDIGHKGYGSKLVLELSEQEEAAI